MHVDALDNHQRQLALPEDVQTWLASSTSWYNSNGYRSRSGSGGILFLDRVLTSRRVVVPSCANLVPLLLLLLLEALLLVVVAG